MSTAALSTAASSTRPLRRRLGGDVYVTVVPRAAVVPAAVPAEGSDPADPSPAPELWVDTGFAVEGWHPRPPARPGRPEFPGTPLQVDLPAGLPRVDEAGSWWEIVATRSEDDSRGAERCVYELRPWPRGHIVRAGVELTAESAARLTAEHRAAARRRAESERAALFMPFYGLLSAAEQEEIESRHGLPPGRATVVTALPILLVSVYTFLLAFVGQFGLSGSDVQLATNFRLLAAYLALESAVRLFQGVMGRPLGSALVVVPMAALRALAASAKAGDSLPAAPGDVPHGAAAWLEATDVVKRVDPSDDGLQRLVVLSPLPKEHWRAQVDLIQFRGASYVLLERQEVPGGHRFLLEEPPPGVRNTRAVHDYDPAEVREVYKEQRRLKAEAWLETLSPLVGFTEPALQLELAEFTRYKPYRAASQSVVLGLVFGAVSLRTGWALFSGLAPADHLAFLGLGAVMVWENAVRAVRLTRGELTPSFLGRLVSPFARRALRWRHDPSWPYRQTT